MKRYHCRYYDPAEGARRDVTLHHPGSHEDVRVQVRRIHRLPSRWPVQVTLGVVAEGGEESAAEWLRRRGAA